jgi:Fe-S cluster assembly ATPase SufC
MKKIDLHIHTVPTTSDSHFIFSLDKLEEYVSTQGIDCIGITNHNLFNLAQFQAIFTKLKILVLPGIEINLESGHLLLLSNPDDLVDFENKCQKVAQAIQNPRDSLSIGGLKGIFPDLSKYLLIPHYDKNPAIPESILSHLTGVITSGEVNSPKKFIYCCKDGKALVPVLFSDLRVDASLTKFPTRQTYISTREISLNAIKGSLQSKNFVSLSEKEGHSFFNALPTGLELSTGLNVILGGRSSGKTFTLDRINDAQANGKYIKQFSLLESDAEAEKKRFNEILGHKHSLVCQEYLREFQDVLTDIADIDLHTNDSEVGKYLESLKKNAQESEREDLFSRSALFRETEFLINTHEGLKKLIDSVVNLIENREYRGLIKKHIPLESLKTLAIDLMKRYLDERGLSLKKAWVNDLVLSIKRDLEIHSASTPIHGVDLFRIAMDRRKIESFKAIAKSIQSPHRIRERDLQGFKIVANKRGFQNATELGAVIGRKISFSSAFRAYSDPYSFLLDLRKNEGLEKAEYHKLFAHISFRILNRFGFEVSGGERSEFNLLQQIQDAQHSDLLLIDEPESSFDNVFLKTEVNSLIQELSQTMPVVIVTHNSSIGASIHPNYLLITQREIVNGKIEYRIYSGLPTDKKLTSKDGKEIENYKAILDCLEAGDQAFRERERTYEALKDQ